MHDLIGQKPMVYYTSKPIKTGPAVKLTKAVNYDEGRKFCNVFFFSNMCINHLVIIINAMTFFKPSGFTNQEIFTAKQMYMAIAKKPAFKFGATTSLYVCMYTCNNFGNAATLLPQKFLTAAGPTNKNVS